MVSSLLVRRVASVTFVGAGLAMVSVGASAVTAGCGSNGTVPEQVYVDATISPTDDDPTSCMLAPGTQFLQIGSVSDERYSLVKNEESFNGANVQVQCKVTPSGSGGGFAVSATAVRSGDQTGGTVTLTGTFTPTGPQTGITAIFGNGTNGIYQQTGCTATYTNTNMGVAAGRVWAVVTCPDMTLQGQANECASSAEVRFENCSE